MVNPIAIKKLYPGQLVVLGQHSTATVFTVGIVDGNMVSLTWFEGQRKCSSWTGGNFFSPSLAQIEYSIAMHGRLATLNDTLEA